MQILAVEKEEKILIELEYVKLSKIKYTFSIEKNPHIRFSSVPDWKTQ